MTNMTIFSITVTFCISIMVALAKSPSFTSKKIKTNRIVIGKLCAVLITTFSTVFLLSILSLLSHFKVTIAEYLDVLFALVLLPLNSLTNPFINTYAQTNLFKCHQHTEMKANDIASPVDSS